MWVEGTSWKGDAGGVKGGGPVGGRMGERWWRWWVTPGMTRHVCLLSFLHSGRRMGSQQGEAERCVRVCMADSERRRVRRMSTLKQLKCQTRRTVEQIIPYETCEFDVSMSDIFF